MPRRIPILRNLGYKIVALLVAVIVWFHVTETLEFEDVMQVPLKLVNLPPGLAVVGDPPSQVTLRVKARGRFIRLRLKGIWAQMDLSAARVGRVSRLLSPADVEVPPHLRAEVVRVISPALVSIECDSLLRRTVSVTPLLRGAPAEGFVQVGEAAVSPPRVRVEGPERLVRGIDSLRTVPVSLRDARGPVTEDTEVYVAGLRGVRVVPEKVTVRVPVEPLENFEVPGVAVQVRAAGGRGRLAWEPREVTLEVTGARRLFQSLRPGELRLVIDAGALPPGYYEYLVQTDGTRWVRLVPFSLGPGAGRAGGGTEASDASRARELRGLLPLPEYLSLKALSPHTFHILVR